MTKICELAYCSWTQCISTQLEQIARCCP